MLEPVLLRRPALAAAAAAASPRIARGWWSFASKAASVSSPSSSSWLLCSSETVDHPRCRLIPRCGNFSSGSSSCSRGAPNTSHSRRRCDFHNSSFVPASSHSSGDGGIPETPQQPSPPPFSSNSLGLWQPLVAPHVSALVQLPEVRRALLFENHHTNDNDQGARGEGDRRATVTHRLDDLRRATDVFAGMGIGNPLHAASLALFAEELVKGAQPEQAVHILQQMQDVTTNHPNVPASVTWAVALGHAKAVWLSGDVAQARTLCDALLNEDRAGGIQFHDTGLPPLVEAAARTGQGVARLVQANSLDDAFSVRDPFRRVVAALERTHPNSAWLVLARCNLGVAEATYASLVQQYQPTLAPGSVPLDAALRVWRSALSELRRLPGRPTDTRKIALETLLLTNMARTLVDKTVTSDPNALPPLAAELASESLQLYDTSQKAEATTTDGEAPWREGFPGTLAVVAACYHKSGSAVTAEGLLQTAVSDPSFAAAHNALPSQLLERAACYQRYADLCRDWEKRDADANHWQGLADQARNALPLAWRHQPTVVGSLWFWTPHL